MHDKVAKHVAQAFIAGYRMSFFQARPNTMSQGLYAAIAQGIADLEAQALETMKELSSQMDDIAVDFEEVIKLGDKEATEMQWRKFQATRKTLERQEKSCRVFAEAKDVLASCGHWLPNKSEAECIE